MAEGNLYLIDLNIEYEGLTQKQFLEIWLEEAAVALKAKEAGKAVQLWKVVGERRAFIVLKTTPDNLDLAATFGLPIMKKMGDQVNLKIISLRPYESYCNSLCKFLSSEKTCEVKGSSEFKDGKLAYWVELDLEYKGIELNDFMKIMLEQSERFLEEKEKGNILDIFKVVGERKILIIFAVDTPDDLDRFLFDFPLMKKNGNNVKVTVKSLRKYESFGEDLKKIIAQ